jgi:hypothetical protein
MSPERDNPSGPRQPRPRVGEPFSPMRRFHVLPMPESLLRSQLPAGAKLVYGRLCRYAGEKNYCWPTPATLAAEVCLGKRQVQNHLRLLEQERFIRREARFENDAQTSNRIVLLWHESFNDDRGRSKGMKSNSLPPVHSSSPRPLNHGSYEESHTQERHPLPVQSPSPKRDSKSFPLGDLSAYSTATEEDQDRSS